jgi:hypothetical protein
MRETGFLESGSHLLRKVDVYLSFDQGFSSTMVASCSCRRQKSEVRSLSG